MNTELVSHTRHFTNNKESRALVKKLTESQIYEDYVKSFSQATGLPLSIRPVESFHLGLQGNSHENRFCAIMGKTNRSCAACLSMQASLEEKAQLAPATLSCFAGLCDTLVPIRVGDKIIAFLQTGQVLLHKPDKEHFTKVTRQLLAWGMDVDLKTLEEAYFQTKVLDEEQYKAFVNMLSTFASHLAIISNQLSIQEQEREPESIKKARNYIDQHYSESLSLESAAKVVNTSVRYFCKVFKQATGMTFTDYLSRVRIEKAKSLLLNPNRRISEVAFEVGFESLSQFNRSFKRLMDLSPTEYRRQQLEW